MTMYKRNYAIFAVASLCSVLSFAVVAEDDVLIRKGDSVITH